MVTSDTGHVLGRIAGDLIVQPGSGTSAPEVGPTAVMWGRVYWWGEPVYWSPPG